MKIIKELGIEKTMFSHPFDLLQSILEAAQEALDDEEYSKMEHLRQGGTEDSFEMDFGGQDDQDNYGLLQALRRIFS